MSALSALNIATVVLVCYVLRKTWQVLCEALCGATSRPKKKIEND